MHQYKSVKIYFYFAVLLLVAKPFLGFTMFSRFHPPAEESIFVKAFTKRKQEYAEDSTFDIDVILKKLADPVKQFFLRFSFLLDILFPATFKRTANLSNGILNKLRLQLSIAEHPYLLNSNLLI